MIQVLYLKIEITANKILYCQVYYVVYTVHLRLNGMTCFKHKHIRKLWNNKFSFGKLF